MSAVVVWALLSGAITGGVWVGIVVLQRHRRLVEDQVQLLREVRQHLDEQEALAQRVVALEERVEFAERLLAGRREPAQLERPREP